MRVKTADVLKLVPEFMRDDGAVKGLAAAVNSLIRAPGARIDTVRIWDKIDELTDEQLDELAYELDIDWYSSALPIEIKRKLVKHSDLTHSRRGTRWAVEDLISSYFEGSAVVEWYEPEALTNLPFHFAICTTDRDVNDAEIVDFMRLASLAMPVRCRIDGVYFADKYGSVIVVQHVDSAHFFRPKKCGTIPRQSTLGGLVDDSGVVAGEGSDGHKFDAPNAGTKVSGTYPRPGTLGSITDAGAVAGEGSLPSIFEPGHSGDEIAGTFPRRTTIGETTTAGAEAGQQTAGSHFTPKIAGTLPRAGTLGGVIPGNGAQAGEATDPSFFTPRKAEGTLGGAIPGSNAKAGESTATSYFAPKQAGTEQKAEGTLGSVQTAEAATVETNDARSFGCIKCGTERCGK